MVQAHTHIACEYPVVLVILLKNCSFPIELFRETFQTWIDHECNGLVPDYQLYPIDLYVYVYASTTQPRLL